MSTSSNNMPTPALPSTFGVRIAGTGSCVPDRVLSNKDLEKMLDTSDEWIVQRTGIRERRICDPEKGESNRTLCVKALGRALEDAHMQASELDLIIIATCTGESTVPAVACRVAAELGAEGAAAFDLVAACSGFVFALNTAHALVRAGAFNTVGVVGCDQMSSILDYTDRSVCILFGDAAGAAVVRVTDDPAKGLITQCMHADGTGWPDLYLPRHAEQLIAAGASEDTPLGKLKMNGRAVYKFAVSRFSELIEETLQKANLTVEQIDHFVCHQSNARILESARERFGIPEEKMYVNIDHYGNSSAGSVPLCFDQLRQAGKITDGQLVMFLAFGAGLTWGSSLWRL